MQKLICSMGVAFVLIMGAATLTRSQPPNVPRKSVLSSLRVGQAVALREVNGSYDISVEQKTSGSHTVVEVGDDFVTIEDVPKITTLRIPVYAVRAIVVVKTKI